MIRALLFGALIVTASETHAAPGLQIVSGDVSSFVPPVLQLGSVDVVVPGDVLYAGGYASLLDVKAGDAVAVTCSVPSGGSLLAFVVAHSPAGITDRITGISVPNQTLVVNGRTISIAGSTLLTGGYVAFDDFAQGDFVAVTGSPQADGSFIASSVTFATATFTGTAQSVGVDQIVVDGNPVQVDAGTTFGGGLGSIGDVKPGQTLRVTGGTRSDGLFLASDVTFLDPTAVKGGAATFAIEPPTNPSRGGSLHARFSLPIADRAEIELLDARGRRLASRDVVGAGWHDVEMGHGLGPGVYFLRLRQGLRLARVRTVVLD